MALLKSNSFLFWLFALTAVSIFHNNLYTSEHPRSSIPKEYASLVQQARKYGYYGYPYSRYRTHLFSKFPYYRRSILPLQRQPQVDQTIRSRQDVQKWDMSDLQNTDISYVIPALVNRVTTQLNKNEQAEFTINVYVGQKMHRIAFMFKKAENENYILVTVSSKTSGFTPLKNKSFYIEDKTILENTIAQAIQEIAKYRPA